MARAPRHRTLAAPLLQPWLTEVDTPDAFLLLNFLGELSRRVTAAYGAFVRPYGIDFSEYVVLWAALLWEPQLPAISQLRRQVVMSSGGIALAVNRLERKRLVRRKTSAHDGRAVLVQLTAKGRRLILELMEADMARHQELLEGLGDARRTAMLDGLADVLHLVMQSPDYAG